MKLDKISIGIYIGYATSGLSEDLTFPLQPYNIIKKINLKQSTRAFVKGGETFFLSPLGNIVPPFKRNAWVTLVEKPQIKIISFQNGKHEYLMLYLIRQSFEGYCCESILLPKSRILGFIQQIFSILFSLKYYQFNS